MSIVAYTAARDQLRAAIDQPVGGEEACTIVAQAIAKVAQVEAAALMTTDPETNLPAGGVVAGFEPSACVPFWDNELLDPDFLKFNDLARSTDPMGTLVEATDGELGRSPRFNKLYSAYGASDELRIAFTQGATCLAIGAFLRVDGKHYSADELRAVRGLLMSATELLRRGLSSGQSDLAHGPAVLLLDANGNMQSESPGVRALFAELSCDVDGDVPTTILVAASKVRSGRVSRTTTRLRGRGGQWFRLHATAMGDDGTVAVTLDRATTSDLVPLLLSSYGFTERETEVVLAMCRGLGTKEIAADLSISAHTVRDHLKVVFEKSGVNSRGELVARLFTDHVLLGFEEAVISL